MMPATPVSAIGVLLLAIAFSVLVLVALPIIIAMLRVARRRAADRSAPRSHVEARVVDKRSQLTGGAHAPTDQRYYVTFEFPDANRVELAGQPLNLASW